MTEGVAARTDLQTVSREIVSFFKVQYGRGPTRASSHWATSDTLVCLLQDTLSPAERKLAEFGQHQAVRDSRAALDHASLPEMCALIESITGRKVRSFGSCVDTVADGEAQLVWTLHPAGYDGPDRVAQGIAAGEFGRHGDPPAERR